MIKQSLHVAVLISLLPILAGAKSIASDMSVDLASISMRDGISKKEATIIAQTYFNLRISGCGVANLSTETAEEWGAETIVGYAGSSQAERIRINKVTGTVRYGENTPTSYLDLLAEAAQHDRKLINIEDGINQHEAVSLARYCVFTSSDPTQREWIDDFQWHRGSARREGKNYWVTFGTKAPMNPWSVRVELDAQTGSLISAEQFVNK